MTRAAKQKAAREATAAYAASQPLFDALRIGFIRVGEQKASLSIARDIVQHLHVKIPDHTSQNERNRYERSIDCAVKAWRSATEIYAEIFEALAKATAAEVNEGRVEKNGHAEFEEMARTAAEAKSAARAFVLHEDIAKPNGKGGEDEGTDETSESESDDEDEDDSEDSESSASNANEEQPKSKVPEAKKEPVDTTPTNSILLHLLGKRPLPQEPPQKQNDELAHKAPRLSEKIKYDAQGRKILWDRGAEKPNVPYGTLGSSEKKAWKAEKKRQRREKKQAKRAARLVEEAKAKNSKSGANGAQLGPDRRGERSKFVEHKSKPVFERDYVNLNGGGVKAEPVSSPSKPVQNGVQYEDVSTEVEARLKAKEEKKTREKAEKKRKRESGVSVDASGVGGEEGKSEKPKRKKAKSVDEGEVGIRAKKEKRKDHEAGEGGDEEGRKKRKKVKA